MRSSWCPEGIDGGLAAQARSHRFVGGSTCPSERLQPRSEVLIGQYLWPESCVSRLAAGGVLRFTASMTGLQLRLNHYATLALCRFRRAAAAYARAALDLCRHRALPGYEQLPWWTRRRIDLRALGAFICSRQCARLLLWLLTWLLASYLLVWQLDLRGPAAAAPPLLALLWVLPWVAHARRREVARLLRHRRSA